MTRRPFLVAAVLDPRVASATERARIGDALEADLGPGVLLVRTCHRVEWYAAAGTARPAVLGEARWLEDAIAARHLLRLAAGLESAVLAEDQILHQLRGAVAAARARGRLPIQLDRLADIALGVGRTARSWLPHGPRDLAVAAIEHAARQGARPSRVLVVGAGAMGRRAVRAGIAGHAAVTVASRTKDRADALARDVGAGVTTFDPGPAVASFDLVIVALSGPWAIGASTTDALLAGETRVVDLSSPPATDALLAARLGPRWCSIDDLTPAADGPGAARLRRRLEELTESSLQAYRVWQEQEPRRAAMREAALRAERLRERELATLWSRLPALSPEDRAEVARMATRLADGLVGELGAQGREARTA